MSRSQELFAEIDTLKAQLDQLRPLDRELEDRVMQKFRLWWTYHSNAIEGNHLSQGETEIFLMEGLTAKGKPLKDHLDLKGHSDAINCLLGFIREKDELTEILIRELHRVLLNAPYRIEAITPEGKPTTKMVAIGEYKSSANHVRTPTGETHFYAKPEETSAKMHELMDWYRSEVAKGDVHSVEIASRFHHSFTAIHPFDDGNGRMARLLTNLMLMQSGYPPVVIRLSERDQYLVALRSADGGEVEQFVIFLAEHVIESLKLFIRAAAGEEISEPTDLKKEIELEIVRLKHIEEPAARSRDLVHALFSSSIKSLVEETATLVSPFCELFTYNTIEITSHYGNDRTSTSHADKMPVRQPKFSDHLTPCFEGDMSITNSRIDFSLQGFLKAGFDTFALSASFNVICEGLKYGVALHTNTQKIPQYHFYQEQLSKDEIKALAEALAKYFLLAIRAKTPQT
jgi:Fic family protein